MKRRDFIKNTGLTVAAMSLAGTETLASVEKAKMKIPKWKGFNLLGFL